MDTEKAVTYTGTQKAMELNNCVVRIYINKHL